ncbi:MAG: hypothetical protein ABEK02_03615 [Haloquadratum sp.]
MTRLGPTCRLVVAVLVVGGVVSVASVPAAAAGVDGGPAVADSDDPIPQTVAVTNAAGAGNVSVTVTYDPSFGSDGFVVDVGSLPGSVTVTGADGFERVGAETYRWNGGGTPSLSYTLAFENPRVVATSLDDPMSADPGGWALVDTSLVVPPLDGGRPVSTIRTVGPGFVTDSWVYLGGVETYTRSVSGETIVLVVPDAAAPVSRPETILTHLATTSREIDIGGRSDRVNVLALPSIGITTPWGGVTSGRDVIVRAGQPVATEPSVWAHEYAHTRQKFRTTPATRWLLEASADYVAGYETLHQDRLSYPAFRRQSTAKAFEDAVLADPSSWASPIVPYVKGERALAHLDEQIRRATGGERTLTDVIRRLNRYDRRVTLGVFYRVIARVSTRETAEEFGVFVQTPEYAPPPQNESNYVESISEDPDGDGLSNADEIENGTSPFAADTDGDTLPDVRELSVLGTDPTKRDTDGDGLRDAQELTAPETDPAMADSDGDGLSDARERDLATDPTGADTDGDGISDSREIDISTSPRYADTDGDGLSDDVESDRGTDPTAVDTDGDGLSDRAERAGVTEPTVADTDGDGYGDAAELDLGTDPTATTGRMRYLRTTVTAFVSGLLG